MVRAAARRPTRDTARQAFVAALERVRLTPHAAAVRAGIPPTTINEYLSGRSASMTMRTYEKIARGTGLTIGQLTGITPPPGIVRLIGSAGAGERIMPIDPADASHEEIECPADITNGFAVVVRGESMRPAYRDGDLLICETVSGVPAAAIGRDCVVETFDDDGAIAERFIKIVARGATPNTYTLVSYAPGVDPIPERRLAYAAPVRWIKRG